MITYHNDLTQGSEEWHQARLGLITASEMHLVLTPTLKPANNEKTRLHLYELLAQRVTGYVEPQYISDAMLRGHEDEILARALYNEKYAPVTEVGFVTNDEWGFKIGYSPDGLVGDDGLIECKSKVAKHHTKTIIEGVVPEEHMLQIQTGLLVTGRKWCDFLSYCGGMPMFRVRAYADDKVQDAIIEAAQSFEKQIAEKLNAYRLAVKDLPMTERRVEEEMVI